MYINISIDRARRRRPTSPQTQNKVIRMANEFKLRASRGALLSRLHLLAHRDGRHFDGQPSLSGHGGHGWTCGLPRPVAMTQGNCKAAP